jgi:hypothetical protein
MIHRERETQAGSARAPNVQVYTFLDLDDTLFQTLPKCPPGEPCRSVAVARDGTPLSYMTRRQARLFELLGGMGPIIPVTARNLDAYRRVDLPFTGLAILDFGGVILRPDGTPDPDWDAIVRPLTPAGGAVLETLLEDVNAFITLHRLGVRARIISDFEMPLYIVMKHPGDDLAALERIRVEHLATLPLGDFFIHANGNNLSLVPRFLGKERAVRHVLERHVPQGDAISLGIGDSLSDVPFLQLCDFMMTPRGTQLAAALAACGLANAGASIR